MKILLYSLPFYLLVVSSLSAQLSIEWQKSLGGNALETCYSTQQTSDGGYIVAGYSLSDNNGDVSGAHGGGDFWVVKLDNSGHIQWQKALGGSAAEVAQAIQQTADGGYIVAGRTFSNNGDVSGHHGGMDYWVVKLSTTGEIEWQKTLGGSSTDDGQAIQQTTDGGFIVAGFSVSNDGDVSGNHGYFDAWIVKLNGTGTIEWQRSYGGANGADKAYAIQQTMDGGYVFAGETNSTDGDFSGNHGSGDFWVVKITAIGELEWQKTLGGEGIDVAWSICQEPNGNYVVLGITGSGNSGDVSGTHGGFDYWVVKLNTDGNIIWQKALGGSGEDYGQAISTTSDGGYVVAGTTRSTDGDVLNNDGLQDYWIVKLDSLGAIQRQKTLGGTMAESAFSIGQTTDGGFIVAGNSQSMDGDVTGNHGNGDIWVVKLRDLSISSTTTPQSHLSIFPNPAQTTITLQIPTTESRLHLRISDLLGRTLRQQTITNVGQADISALPSGLYLLSVTAESGQVYVGKLRKE